MDKAIYALRLIIITAVFISTPNAENYYLIDSEDTYQSLAKYAAITTSDIQGTITDSNDTPIADVQVMLLGNNSVISTLTDSNGHYSFSGIRDSTYYTIIPSKFGPGGFFDSSNVSGDTVIEIARDELGNTDGPSPGIYHGHGGAWCSEFVSWAYDQAGEPFTGGSADGGACSEEWIMSTVYRVVAGFGRNENWQFMPIEIIADNWQDTGENPLAPQAGDYVLFSNTTGVDRSHSGMVDSLLGTSMHTIEGNVSNLVQALTRSHWLTDRDGNTIVKGIGYRRIVSSIDFSPRYYYRYITRNRTVDFMMINNEFMVTYQPGVPQLILPHQFYLSANYPNPFYTTSSICYSLPVSTDILLSVYDVSGNLVHQWSKPNQRPGTDTIVWDGRDLNNHKVTGGVYLFRMNAFGRFSHTRRMVFLNR